MIKKVLESRFECVESGCDNLVDPQTSHAITLSAAEYSTTLAAACEGCGRLYSVFTAEPVFSSDYMKVFSGVHQLEHKQLTAVEKYNLIHGALSIIESSESFEQGEMYKRRIVNMCGGAELWNARRISRAMHAPDCEAVFYRATHMCNCGVVHARDWFKNHDTLVLEE